MGCVARSVRMAFAASLLSAVSYGAVMAQALPQGQSQEQAAQQGGGQGQQRSEGQAIQAAQGISNYSPVTQQRLENRNAENRGCRRGQHQRIQNCARALKGPDTPKNK